LCQCQFSDTPLQRSDQFPDLRWAACQQREAEKFVALDWRKGERLAPDEKMFWREQRYSALHSHDKYVGDANLGCERTYRQFPPIQRVRYELG